MKKQVLCITVIMGICISAIAADQIISYKVPDAKVQITLQRYLTLYPNTETIDDPTWVDPKDGSIPNQIPKYTDKQWFKEKVRRVTIRDINRGKAMIRKKLQDQTESADGSFESI